MIAMDTSTSYPGTSLLRINMADCMKERLEKRQEARLIELDRRRQERADQTRPEEDPKSLISTFNKEKEIVEKMLEDAARLEKSLLREHFDETSRKTQLLQKFLSDSLVFLPCYDVKKRQQEINKLEQDISEKRNFYLPKKKFAFSKKKQATKEQDLATRSEESVVVTSGSNEEALPGNTDTESRGSPKDGSMTTEVFTSGQHITQKQADLLDKDITFSKLRECTITLYGSPSALRLEKLEHCKVFCGPVSGSVFINDCKDSVFVFPCQQLRVHATVSSQFYLHVTSRAIIEDSQQLGFAEFNWSYEGMDGHFEISRLDKTKNNWNLVNDFNWLRTDVHSPNWYLIKDEEKIKSWN